MVGTFNHNIVARTSNHPIVELKLDAAVEGGKRIRPSNHPIVELKLLR